LSAAPQPPLPRSELREDAETRSGELIAIALTHLQEILTKNFGGSSCIIC